MVIGLASFASLFEFVVLLFGQTFDMVMFDPDCSFWKDIGISDCSY
jgi:hypothetical protein